MRPWLACGKNVTEGASGPVSFELKHVLEVAAENIDRLPHKKMSMRVTLHDPCNYAVPETLLNSRARYCVHRR